MIYAVIILAALLAASLAFHYITWEKLVISRSRANLYETGYDSLLSENEDLKEERQIDKNLIRGLRFNARKDHERCLIVEEERDGAHMLLERILSQNADLETPKLHVQAEIGRDGVHYVFSYDEPRDISTMNLASNGRVSV